MKLHVLGGSSTASTPAPAPVPPPAGPSSIPAVNSPVNPNGPVVMPPANAATVPVDAGQWKSCRRHRIEHQRRPGIRTAARPKSSSSSRRKPPTPMSGQSIPLRIDFYIRMEVERGPEFAAHDQGQRFPDEQLHGARTRQQVVMLEGEQYGAKRGSPPSPLRKAATFPWHGARHLLGQIDHQQRHRILSAASSTATPTSPTNRSPATS